MTLQYGLAALIAILLGCYFRLYPILFPISSTSEEKAAALIVTQTRTNIAKNIAHLYPGLDENKKQALANEKFQEWSHANKNKLQKNIFTLAQKIYHQDRLENPSQKAPETYLPDSDSYYFYGMTKQLIDGQKIMEKRKGAEYFNALMLAPVGYWEKINYHPYIGFLTYKIIHAINPQTSAMVAVSFTPILLMIISILLFTLCCRSLMISPWATALGSIFFALAPIFLRRSFFGWYDNDPYNILFPLLITLLTFWGIENLQNTLKRSILAFLVALSIAAYAYFWQGWVYMFCVLLASGAMIIAIEFFILKKEQQYQGPLSFLGIVFATTFAGIIASFGIKQFFSLFQEGWSVLNEFFASSNLSLWPDIYLSVGELHGTSLTELVDLCGNPLWALIAFAGLIFILSDNIQNFSKKNIYKTVFVLVFLLSAFVLTLKAQRFAVLLIAPFCLCGAYGLQKLFHGAKFLLNKMNIPLNFLKISYLLLSVSIGLALLAGPILKADSWAMRIRPIFNEQWDRTLSTLKEKTPSNSIINTWWSPGHFIKTVAQRSVTFDGATINVPQAYWMAQALYSSDETYALGILRMLNTSANKATEYLLSQNLKLSQAVSLIQQIVILSQENARDLLNPYLTPKQIQTLLSFTHGAPPPSYILLYNDLMETNIGIGFAARWNIKKIEEINASSDILAQVRKMKHQDFIDLLWNIQGGMLRYSETITQLGRQGNKIIFDNGILVDLDTKTCQIASPTFGTGVPRILVYENDETVIKKELPQANLPFAVVLFSEGKDRYGCLLMDEVIADSLLVRLYFFKAKGLRYITPFLDEHDLTGRTQLFAFQVNWSLYQNDTASTP